MVTTYPNSVDAFTPQVNNTTDFDASFINDMQDGVTAVQSTVGLTPVGSYADIDARMTAIDFAAATTAVFLDASPPTGWTQVAENGNVLRVVSGSATGTGGSVDVAGGSFTMPGGTSHNHAGSSSHETPATSQDNSVADGFLFATSAAFTHNAVGNESAHTHPGGAWNLAYRNILLADKD